MIKLLRIIALFILYFHVTLLHGRQAYCIFDADVRKIYGEIVNLNLDLAKSLINNKAETSDNKAYLLLDNEIDFYQLFVYDQKPEYQNRQSQKNTRVELLDNSDLPLEWKRFIKAEILLQWALLFLKHDEEIRAFQNIRESVQLLEENTKEFPDFIYSYKSLGILHTLLSTIPEGFQWAARLFGLNGNLQSGKFELQKYIQFAEASQDIFLDESYAAMSFIISYLDNKPDDAFQYWIRKMGIKEPHALHVLVQCKMACKAGLNDAALNAIQSLGIAEKEKLPYLYFLLGLTNLQKLNQNADQYFLKFLQVYKGSSFIKEAYQKLAWSSLLKRDLALYHLYMSNCLTKGNALTDEEKQAMQEAQSAKIPDLVLLKARLLFDGGYSQQAYDELNGKKSEYFSDGEKQLECAYRLGRICQMKKETDNALQFYKNAIDFDPQYNSYMSCNALLQCAVILENQKKIKESKAVYLKVLETNPDMYKRSIHQKAKAGLVRLKNIIE